MQIPANHLSAVQWRSDIIRYFQRGQGERIPVMMIGLKRDLRVEDDQIIYPEEVSKISGEQLPMSPPTQSTFQTLTIYSPTELLKNSVVIATQSALLSQGS